MIRAVGGLGSRGGNPEVTGPVRRPRVTEWGDHAGSGDGEARRAAVVAQLERELNAHAYTAQGRAGRHGRAVSAEGITLLDCSCWCGAEYRPIPSVMVRAGRTWSCGREGCHG